MQEHRPAGKMQRRRSTDILAKENIMAMLEECSDSDNDSVDTKRLAAMAHEQQLQKQFNRGFNIHDAVAMAMESREMPANNKWGKRPASSAAKIDQEFIVAALSRNDLFLDLGLSQERIAEAATRFERSSYADGTVILDQGDDDFQSMYWYLIAKGRCQVLIDGRPLPRMGRYGGLTRGKTFGEVSLMREEPRSATIVAEGEVVLYQLARRDFLEVIEMTHDLGSDDIGNDEDNHKDVVEQQQTPGDTSVETERANGEAIEEAGASGSSNEDLTEERNSRYEESMPQLTDIPKEEEGGSSSGLLGSWYEQTSTRLAPLMQRGESQMTNTGGFAQRLFSIVGAGLKEEIVSE